jgi:superfamily II RNA helicase
MSVTVCEKEYPKEQENNYKNIFESYPFNLDHFQKFAIEAIEKHKHVLVTAHTGSGKSLCAEFAITKYCTKEKPKKVIYTSPIKSLSNQKFHEFTEKYPDVSFGILTGDIKFNPEADCIVMTTEILRNALFRGPKSDIDYSLDISQIGCVIFDEIHYINDRDRGKVWEETIIKLPKEIQMVMLSATIDRSEAFAKWIATTKCVDVWLTSTDTRVVPLNHYSFFKVPDSFFKKIKEQQTTIDILGSINDRLVPLKKHKGNYKSETVKRLHKIQKELSKKCLRISPKFILNQACEYLHINQMLPAITFVFSRRKVVEYAKCIEHSLYYGNEQQLSATVEKECKRILMDKLQNYQEYINLPEFREMIGLLKKGIAIHHSGILPVLREMVEMLFTKGFIKMLFATETFAVGVNMPTKTVLFTDLSKFDGNGFRHLLSHEYTQMAGRAGRRGLDPVGHVIHLNGMFELPTVNEYQKILNGNPQRLLSKFEIDFGLILRVLSTNESVQNLSKASMINNEISAEYQAVELELNKLVAKHEKYLEMVQNLKTSKQILEEYQKLQETLQFSKNKKRKRIVRQIRQLENTYNCLVDDYKVNCKLQELTKTISNKTQELDGISNYITNTIDRIIESLKQNTFLDSNGKLTKKGIIGSKIQEVNCMVVSEALINGEFDDLNSKELAAVLSSFVPIRVPNDLKSNQCENYKLQMSLVTLNGYFDRYYNLEMKTLGYCREENYTLLFDLPDIILDWCTATDQEFCLQLINEVAEKEIFLGEFVKLILKINNIAHELEQVCDIIENYSLKKKLSEIPELTLKYIVTNQSLYV